MPPDGGKCWTTERADGRRPMAIAASTAIAEVVGVSPLFAQLFQTGRAVAPLIW
jgi:hypothetical protein